MKRLLALVGAILLACTCQAPADGVDDQYVRIYNLIQEGDLLFGAGQAVPALAKYNEAHSSLLNFERLYPAWNPKVVAFRMNYLAGRITELSGSAPPTGTRPAPQSTAGPVPVPTKGPSTTTPIGPSSPGPTSQPQSSPANDAQINSLKDQLRQLQAEKVLLEAKVKEALTAIPAASDPRELAKAEERVRALLKENDLLKANLDQVKNRAAKPSIDPAALQKTQKDLADANRRLAEQTDKANLLTGERNALQAKLKTLEPNAWNAAALVATKSALEEANRQVLLQKDAAARLAADKAALQTRLNAMSADVDAAGALRVENQLLKKELAELRSSVSSSSTTAASRKLAEAQAQIATLRSDRELLRLEKMALEDRLRKSSSGPGTALASTGRPEDARIRQLEQERDDLQKKLEVASKELYGRNSKPVTARVQDLETQLSILRARLEVFEARQVPYTPEELALFKKPDITIASNDSNAGKKPVRELPSGSATLVAEAERYFSARQFDKAEDRYLQVLHKDERNVPTLANLAAIQLEMNHLDEAEKHVKQAITLAPDDAYSLSILGYLKFRQEKYDDALDALSKAAKLDPQNAQIQNYLGITLSQKGNRGAAETALRKAVSIEPGYGSAHHNLAVIYATQRPPLTELARWHYQKAIRAGHPPNPQLEKVFDSQKPADDTPGSKTAATTTPK